MPSRSFVTAFAAVVTFTGISGAADVPLDLSQQWTADAERAAAEAKRARTEVVQAGLPSAQESSILSSMTRSQEIVMATLQNQREFISLMASQHKTEQKNFILAIVGLVLTNGLTIYKLWSDRKRQRG